MAFSLEFQKLFSITRTIFSLSKSEQFWKRNTIFYLVLSREMIFFCTKIEFCLFFRFSMINPEDFILTYQKGFAKIIKTILNVRASDVVILSVQTSRSSNRSPRTALWSSLQSKNDEKSQKRPKRDEKRALPELQDNFIFNETIEPELEVLFIVKKNNNDQYFIREKIRHQLRNKLSSISSQLGLTVLEI